MKHSFTQRYLLLLMLLPMAIGAFASNKTYYSKATATLVTSGAGKVYVANSSNTQGSSTTATKSSSSRWGAPTHTYCFTATLNNGYVFAGWWTGKTNGDQTSSDLKYNEDVTAESTTESSPTTCNRYARYTAIAVSAASAQSASFNHPETQTVTLSFPVTSGADAKADFNDPTITANTGWSISSWSVDKTNSKVNVVCSFTASSDVAKNTYEATVTLKSKANKSNTGKVSASVDLTPTFTYKDGSVDVSVSDDDKVTLNLNDLCTAYKGADNVAGDGAITYKLKTANSNVSLTSAGVFYAKATGTYTIIASAAKKRYYAATKEFNVTVNQRTPTIVWKDFGNIYSSNTLENVVSLTYNNKTITGVGVTLESQNTDVLTVDDKDKNKLHAQILTTQQSATIKATTEATTFYKSVNDTHEYTVEAKKTPVMKLNGQVLTEEVTTISLKIGETANMTFDKIEEGDFSYPKGNGQATYTHNSTAHTGVITANYFGSREMVFEQTGTNTAFGQKRTVKVLVQKHPVTIAATSALSSKDWKVDNVFEGNLYTVNTPASGQPAQNEIKVSTSNDGVLQLVGGKWKAVAAGDAVLTIAQATNDYWTGDTITLNVHVSKHDPVITWNIASEQNWAAVVDNPVSSSNTDLPFVVKSGDTNKADYVDGKIEVYNVNGDVTFTLEQEGNYKWNAKTETKTITVNKPANHVTFTIASANKDKFFTSSSSNVSWQSSGYRLCDGGWDVLDDYFIIQFTGVPQTLTFEKTLEKSLWQLPGTCDCKVYESPDNKTWSASPRWENSDKTESVSASTPLSASTRYLKFCYHGTVYANYKNIKVTERSEIVAPKESEFPSGGIGDEATIRPVKIAWYNVRTCNVTISGADARYFKLVNGSETIHSHLDDYNENENIYVKYLHEEIKKHSATLTITSADGKTASVTLKGETTKAAQEIIWNENLIVNDSLLIAKGTSYTEVATASSELPVQLYIADGDNKLKVMHGDTILGLADGTTTLYAKQEGNENKWAAAYDTIGVRITNKALQTIEWNDSLSNIQYIGATKKIALSARSSKDASLPITYELDSVAQTFASIEGNNLIIKGCGTGKITAIQTGNSTYVRVSVSRTMTSYNPNEACNQHTVYSDDKEFSLGMGSEYIVDLTGEPEELTFTAEVGKSDLIVQQLVNNEWSTLATLSKASKTGYGPYPLSRDTRQIKFKATTVIAVFGSGHTISDVQVTKARYLELEENYMDFSSVQKGQTVNRQFKVNYSDASGVFEVKLEKKSNQFQLESFTLGTGCDATKKGAVIKVSCTGKTIGKEENKIIISNKTDSLKVPVTAVVTGLTQQIHWGFEAHEEIKTTDEIEISATADSELPVTFKSNDESVAKITKVDGKYYLDIIKGGEDVKVTIIAEQAGDDSWESTSKECEFVISKVTPEVTKWPTAAEVVLPKTLAGCTINNDAVTSVAGSFEWETPATEIARNNSGYTVVFKPTKSDWYNEVTNTIAVPVAKTPQTITWNFSDLEMYCDADITFDAQASSGYAVTYESSDPSIAYVNSSNQLIINKGGDVTITARQGGDETYAAADSVPKQLKILRVSPEIVTMPVADTMKVAGLLSDATIRGGLVKLGNTEVDGRFSWEDGNTTAMNEAGKFTKRIVFSPTEAGWYEPIYDVLEVVVEKYAPVIATMGLTAADITYGTELTGTLGLSGTIVATDTVKKPNVTVEGTYAWVAKEGYYDVSTQTATAVFIPKIDGWYNRVEFEVPLHVDPATISYTATATVDQGQSLSGAVFENTTTGLNGEAALGTISWAADVDQTIIPTVGGTYAITVKAAEGSNYSDGDGLCTLTIVPGIVFNGDAESEAIAWGNSDNWTAGALPGENDRVTINANVEITTEVAVSGLTINENKTVTVKDGGVLTIGDEGSLYRANYGNIIVEAGGKLNLGEGEVKVNDFTLYSGFDGAAPKSGQVTGQKNLTTKGDAYFIFDLDRAGEASRGWYDFTVPFPVDALHGITRLNGNQWETIVNEVNYAVMDFHEDLFAQGKYGWKKYKGILQPGRGYTMTIDCEINRYRFQMVENGEFNIETNQTLDVSSSGVENHTGWNIIGNGVMSYVKFAQAPSVYAQLYNHTERKYEIIRADDKTFVVGAAYFMQAGIDNNELSLIASDAATGLLRAPQRENTSDICRVDLTIASEGKARDNLFVTCDDDASATYTVGKDVQKLGASTDSRVACMWANAKGTNLGAVDVAYSNNLAVVPLQIYAPQSGEYTLALDNNPTEDVYLTRNGSIVWNLSMSSYVFQMDAGTDASYGLLVIRRVNNTATGVDQTDNQTEHGTDFVEKIIVNGQLYILRDSIMYDAQGKRVSNF